MSEIRNESGRWEGELETEQGPEQPSGRRRFLKSMGGVSAGALLGLSIPFARNMPPAWCRSPWPRTPVCWPARTG